MKRLIAAVHESLSWHETEMAAQSLHICYRGVNGPDPDGAGGPSLTRLGQQAQAER
jgi:hypothetical protein